MKPRRSPFTDDEVRSMREEYAADPTMTYDKLAVKYDATAIPIHRVITGKSYLHVTQGINIARPTSVSRYTEEELTAIKDAHKEGKSLKQLGDELGHRRQHVWDLINSPRNPKPAPQVA